MAFGFLKGLLGGVSQAAIGRRKGQLSAAEFLRERRERDEATAERADDRRFNRESRLREMGQRDSEFERRQSDDAADREERTRAREGSRREAYTRHQEAKRTKESELDSIADSAIEAASGDPRKAAEILTQDPRGLESYKNGMATRHLYAAATRYKNRLATKKPSPDDDIRKEADRRAAAKAAPALTPDREQVVSEIVAAIKAGTGTLEQAKTANLAPAEVAEIERRLGGGT